MHQQCLPCTKPAVAILRRSLLCSLWFKRSILPTLAHHHSGVHNQVALGPPGSGKTAAVGALMSTLPLRGMAEA